MSGMIEPSSPKIPDISFFNEHYHCDYIEFLALIQNGDVVSDADIYSRYNKFDLGVDNASREFGLGGDAGFSEDQLSESSVQGESEFAEFSDKWEQRLREWFMVLRSRQEVFGESYPFVVGDGDTIKLKDDLSDENYTYIFLLLCSSLNSVGANFRSILTTDFEEISCCAIRNYLPEISVVHKFGKSASTNDRYVGGIKEKIEMLAADIRRQSTYKDHFFSQRNSGDLGIDIVAWVPVKGDENFGYIQIFFAQCGAGKNWIEKQYEPITSIKNSISELDNATCVVFIPYDARNSDGQFNEEARLERKMLLFDRRRIMSLLGDVAGPVSQLNSFSQVVSTFVHFQESLV